MGASRKPATTRLEIHDVRLEVHLGAGAKERAKPQAVLVNLRISFRSPPKACATDRLEDTVCYATLLERLRAYCAGSEFRLLEKLARDLYDETRKHIGTRPRIGLQVRKTPPIAGVAGASFTYGDPG